MPSGYTAEVRTRVMENICAVRAFDVSSAKLHEREAKLRAACRERENISNLGKVGQSTQKYL